MNARQVFGVWVVPFFVATNFGMFAVTRLGHNIDNLAEPLLTIPVTLLLPASLTVAVILRRKYLAWNVTSIIVLICLPFVCVGAFFAVETGLFVLLMMGVPLFSIVNEVPVLQVMKLALTVVGFYALFVHYWHKSMELTKAPPSMGGGQVHLSTCVLLEVFAGVLIWLNVIQWAPELNPRWDCYQVAVGFPYPMRFAFEVGPMPLVCPLPSLKWDELGVVGNFCFAVAVLCVVYAIAEYCQMRMASVVPVSAAKGPYDSREG